MSNASDSFTMGSDPMVFNHEIHGIHEKKIADF